jgi:hypothetical protein
MSKWRSVGIITLVSVCCAAFADERPRAEEPSHAVEQPSPAAAITSQLCRIDIKGEKKDQWMRRPKPESSVTQHRFAVGGKSFDYTAAAGTLIICYDEDKPIASIGYVAYVRHDLKGGGARPPSGNIEATGSNTGSGGFRIHRLRLINCWWRQNEQISV